MFGTIVFIFGIVCYVLFLLYVLLKPGKFSKRKLSIVVASATLILFAIFTLTGAEKIRTNVTRIIHNTAPKPPAEIYTILFKKVPDSSISITNLQDQVIPKIDCCIWLQLKIRPDELNRILQLKKYDYGFYLQADSANFLQSFNDKPNWWRPQILGDTIRAASIYFANGNEQWLLFSNDSNQVFVCDKAP